MEINGIEDRKTIEKRLIGPNFILWKQSTELAAFGWNWPEKETIQSTKIMRERVDIPDLTEIIKGYKVMVWTFCVSELCDLQRMDAFSDTNTAAVNIHVPVLSWQVSLSLG